MPLDSAEPFPAHVREIEVGREIYDSVRVDGKGGACLLRIGEDRSVRLTFNRGALEIMSPKRLHEQITRLIDMVVTLLAFELGLNVDNCGAMTLRVASAQRGGEPDSCFYITNEARVRGVEEI